MKAGAAPIRKVMGVASDLSQGGVANFQPNLIGGFSAERCVPREVPASVLVDHIQRYIWALPRVDGLDVVELGSGAGYGTHLLSLVAESATGVDISPLAVEKAQSTYPGPAFVVGDITAPKTLPRGDVAVCFEVLEHVREPIAVLEAALERYPRLLLSVPNPLVGGSHINPHHRLDWPLRKLLRHIQQAGGRDIQRFHQRYFSPAVRRGCWGLSVTWILDITRDAVSPSTR